MPKWLPNILSFTRLLVAAPAIVWFVFIGSWKTALVFAILGGLTDGLDGYLARSRNACTKFGSVLDPVADGALISAVLLALISTGHLPVWTILVAALLAVTVHVMMLPTFPQYIIAIAKVADFLMAVTGGVIVIILLAVTAFPGHPVQIVGIAVGLSAIVVTVQRKRIATKVSLI